MGGAGSDRRSLGVSGACPRPVRDLSEACPERSGPCPVPVRPGGGAAMQREVGTLPLAPALRARLAAAGFQTAQELLDTGPCGLSKGTGGLGPRGASPRSSGPFPLPRSGLPSEASGEWAQ